LLSDTLYKSTDNGITWNYVNTPTDYNMGGHLAIDESDNIYIDRGKRFWLYDPWGNPIYTYMDYKIFRSGDAGQNWQLLFLTRDEDQIFQMFTIPQGNLLIDLYDLDATQHYGNGYNRIFSLDEGNWAIFEENIIKYTSSRTQGISFTSNDGQTWSRENSGLTNLHTYSLLRDSLGYLYTGTDNSIFKSNFTSYSFSLQTNYQFEDTRLGDTTYKQIILTNPFDFELSLDSINTSNTNFFISQFSSINLPPNGSTSIEIGFAPDSIGSFCDFIIVYSGSVVGRFGVSGVSLRPTLIVLPFTNFGSVFVGDTASSELKLTSQSVNEIIIDSLYMAINDQFFVDPMIFPMNLNYEDTLNINIHFAPTVQSIIFKKDTVVINSNSVNSEVFQVVTGRGVNPTSAVEENLIITEFNLSNNFPNPFNPSTSIEYQVPKISFVNIIVYNLLGEEIAVLVNEEKNLGKYQIHFDGTNFPSGVYFYKIQAGYFTTTKKFILLK
ncbi:MAG: T9SS type A sorting domain-containing protein, partial [Ignavibacteria bacterium]|nr:T9SS type A sorting domain-containing protein [Ignavibacteria bacterium]